MVFQRNKKTIKNSMNIIPEGNVSASHTLLGLPQTCLDVATHNHLFLVQQGMVSSRKLGDVFLTPSPPSCGEAPCTVPLPLHNPQHNEMNQTSGLYIKTHGWWRHSWTVIRRSGGVSRRRMKSSHSAETSPWMS